jgi:hypothetical protein
MKSRGWIPLVAVIACSVVAIVAIFFAFKSTQNKDIATIRDTNANPSAVDRDAKSDQATDDWIDIGGIKRPPTDVKLADGQIVNQPPVVKAPQGFSPALDPKTNPQVAGVYAALKDRSEPSKFSSFAEAKPFDRDAYENEPQAYLDTVEPARVFSPAQPGDGVAAIQADGSRFHRVKQGETVRLAVKAVAGAPVTFTSFDLGSFENKLSSVTVRAGEDGVAQANYTAGGGTIDIVKILAAGPVTTGQVAFNVHVSVPGE